MTAFVAEHRDSYGVEPICKVLKIAPSTYYTHAARKADPERRSVCTQFKSRCTTGHCDRRQPQGHGMGMTTRSTS
jgi:hypothetical protein